MANISQYQVVIPGQTITAALWNGMELNIINNGLKGAGIEDYSATDGEMQTQTDPFPGSVISKPTSLAGELERIRWQFDNIIGGTYWYEDPPVDITTFKTRFDAHSHDGTTNNGPQITVDGLAANSVTTAKILDLNVTTAKINDSAVTTAKILDANVTNGKIANFAIDADKLASSVAGDGLAGGGGTALSVNVDNSTIEINSDQIRVKDAGIGSSKISPTYVLTARPSFLAYLSADLSNVTGNSVSYSVIFNTEAFDQASNYNNSTGVFTAPTTGIYVFLVSIRFGELKTTTHNQTVVKLVTTSKTFTNTKNIASGGFPLREDTSPISVVTNMTSGDTAYIQVVVADGSQDVDVLKGTLTQDTFFSGALLF